MAAWGSILGEAKASSGTYDNLAKQLETIAQGVKAFHDDVMVCGVRSHAGSMRHGKVRESSLSELETVHRAVPLYALR